MKTTSYAFEIASSKNITALGYDEDGNLIGNCNKCRINGILALEHICSKKEKITTLRQFIKKDYAVTIKNSGEFVKFLEKVSFNQIMNKHDYDFFNSKYYSVYTGSEIFPSAWLKEFKSKNPHFIGALWGYSDLNRRISIEEFLKLKDFRKIRSK